MSAKAVMSGVKAVSFDLDDTLWDCASVIRHAEDTAWQWFQNHAPRVTNAHEWSVIPNIRSEVAEREPHLLADVTRLRRTIFKELLSRYEYPEHMADHAFDVFYEARSNVTLYSGVLDMLEQLQRHFKVAAITNGNADLAMIGIDHYFSDIQIASVHSPPKPAAFMFDECFKNLGVGADEVIHIGDNPHTDVFGGRNAGARTIWFNQTNEHWPEDLPTPDLTATSIEELTNILMVHNP